MISYSPLYLPLLAWFFSAAGTWQALLLLKEWGVMDAPNARSNHSAPVPRGGGVGMIFATLAFLAAAGVPMFIIAAAALLAAVSFIDDVKNLPVSVRLLAQAIAVVIALYALPGRLFPEIVPLVCERLFIALLWLWLINLTNFMDGIDGITSLQTIAVMLGICLVSVVLPSLPRSLPLEASIVAAAVLGFYWFNRSPAKLFMGDAGSVPLGYLTGYLLLSLAMNGQFLPALILPAYYICDATFTLLRRLIRGEKVWQAHSDHAYQQAVRAGLSHNAVICRIAGLNMILIVLAILAVPHMMTGIFLALAGYLLTACLMRQFFHASAA